MTPRRQWKRWTTEQAREALERWAVSGLSLREFAQQETISLGKLTRWKLRLDGVERAHGQDVHEAQSIVPVRITARSGRSGHDAEFKSQTRLSLRLRDGTRIQLSGPNPEALCDAVFGALQRWELTC